MITVNGLAIILYNDINQNTKTCIFSIGWKSFTNVQLNFIFLLFKKHICNI